MKRFEKKIRKNKSFIKFEIIINLKYKP